MSDKAKDALTAVLDWLDLTMTPKRWNIYARRAYLILLPVSAPLVALWSMIAMISVLAVAAILWVALLVCKFGEYSAELWKDESK